MDEPVGHTIDGTPWEEARGPHLPDRLTRITGKLPRASWAFIILAVLIGSIRAFDGGRLLFDSGLETAAYIQTVVGLVLGLIPPIATILFGAALFARHPRAWTSHRVLAVGLVMLAVGEAMQAASSRLAELFMVVTPSDDTFLTPGLITYNLMTAILIVLGTVYLARGSNAARLRPDRVGGRRMLVMVFGAVLLAGSSIVASIVTIAGFASDDPDVLSLSNNLVVLVVGWLAIAAQAYLAVVLWAGMSGGEQPGSAWRLGTAGVWSILVASASASLGTAALFVVAPGELDFTIWSWISLVWVTVSVVGYLLVLAAFARGLPTPSGGRPGFVG